MADHDAALAPRFRHLAGPVVYRGWVPETLPEIGPPATVRTAGGEMRSRRGGHRAGGVHGVRRTEPLDRRLLGLAAVGLGGMALAATYQVSGGRIGVPCLMRMTTGLDCPLCGSTRMAAALLRGDLGAAWAFNAPVLVIGSVTGLAVGYQVAAWCLERLGLARLRRNPAGPPYREPADARHRGRHAGVRRAPEPLGRPGLQQDLAERVEHGVNGDERDAADPRHPRLYERLPLSATLALGNQPENDRRGGAADPF